MIGFGINVALLIIEYRKVQSEHVKGSNARCNQRYIINHPVIFPGGAQNFFLTKKTCKRRNARNSQTSYQKCDMGNRHEFSQASHIRHFIAVNKMYNRTGTEEQ